MGLENESTSPIPFRLIERTTLNANPLLKKKPANVEITNESVKMMLELVLLNVQFFIFLRCRFSTKAARVKRLVIQCGQYMRSIDNCYSR